MKTRIFAIIYMLSCVLLFSACSDDSTVGTSPVKIGVSVFSGTGDNVLDDYTITCILDREISVTFRGKNYPLVKDSRAVLPEFSNPVLVNGIIWIGDLDGLTESLQTILLHLGKAEYTITLNNIYVKDGRKTKIIHRFYLNDKVVSEIESVTCKIKIVLNPSDI